MSDNDKCGGTNSGCLVIFVLLILWSCCEKLDRIEGKIDGIQMQQKMQQK